MPETCLECGDGFKGRSDKKFCSDACRSSFNNKYHKDTTNLMRSINRTLRKNRSILEKLTILGETYVSKTTLILADFNFLYHTSIFQGQQDINYFFCYEMGYSSVDNLWYTVIKIDDLRI